MERRFCDFHPKSLFFYRRRMGLLNRSYNYVIVFFFIAFELVTTKTFFAKVYS